MDTKDIDRLLTCRKAIDDHRVRKADARVSTSMSVPLQTAFTASLDIYQRILADNGFKSYEAFAKFNEQMCIESIKENVTFSGRCDADNGCTSCNKEMGIDPKEWKGYTGQNLCFYASDQTAIADSQLSWQEWLFKQFINRGITFRKDAAGNYKNFCPDGVGYTLYIKDLPFDLWWK